MVICSECGAVRAYLDLKHVDGSIATPNQAYEAVREHLEKSRVERLVGLYLDAQNKPIGEPALLSVGSLNVTRTCPREVMLPAIERSAVAFILAHNHPSGNLDPSTDDVEFTRTMHEAGKLMGISLYDHLVVSRTGYVSLKSKQLMTWSE